MASILTISEANPAPPCSIVILGASGDLARRKLLPALYNLESCGEGLLPPETAILGFARTRMTTEEFRNSARESVGIFSRLEVREGCWRSFEQRLEFMAGLDQPDGFKRLRERLEEIERGRGLPPNRIFYLSIPPDAMRQSVERLAEAGLITRPSGRNFSRVVVEKPIGHDLESALDIGRTLSRFLDESQIFRIDHYLGKETVQNILMFRFANTLFEPAWNRAHIDHIQITSSETLGVERRAGYYDRAGVVRDMFQNHLMQLMCLIAMEPPTRFDADAVRDRRLDVMKAVRPFSEHDLDKNFVFGQYAGGVIEGGPVPAYRGEPGVPPESLTPTYAAIKLCVDNWRWQGVPFYLRSGKRLKERVTEIAVYFKQVPVSIFQPLPAEQLSGNILKFRVQPEEGISINFEAKHPGPKLCISTVTMDFDYRETFGTPPPEAYDRLLLDAMAGDQTIFARADEVEEAWSIFDPAVRYAEAGKPPEFYPAGGRGPEASDAMLARDGRTWDF